MRKFIETTLCIMVLLASTVSAVGDVTIDFDGSGDVGVKTNTPSASLHVNDNTNTPSTLSLSSDVPFKITGTSLGMFFDSNQIETYGDSLFLNYRYSPARNVIITRSNGGNVGIGDNTPSEKLEVYGNVRADDFIEYSDIYIGDALSKVKAISHEPGTEHGDWADVDHDTLPEGVRVNVKEMWLKDKMTGEIVDDDDVRVQADSLFTETQMPTGRILLDERGEEIEETEATYVHKATGEAYASHEEWIEEKFDKVEVDVPGRSLGNTAQLNLQAIRQLLERDEAKTQLIEELRARIEKLEGK